MKTILFFAPMSVLLLFSCKKTELNSTNEALKTSDSGVNPVVISSSNNGGNVACSEAAAASGLADYEFTTGKQDYPFSSSSFGNGVSVTTDGTYVSWSIDPPVGFCVTNVAVIVKGGASANVYYYNNGESSDTGLTSPSNASGNPAGLSNLTICYNLIECTNNETCDWQEETAFGGGIAGGGNSWWFALDASANGSYPIYAGQQPVAGAYVQYDASTDEIQIVLGSQMQLQNVSEPVKVEGYDVLPLSRPSAGLFQLYKGSNLTVQGNGSAYYVIHLDVEVCK